MNLHTLGNSSIKVAPLCFGGNVFGWTASETVSFKLLDAFTAGGFNFIDTADVYSFWVPGHTGGESEIILGKWMKSRGNRKQLVIATKVGMKMGDGREGLSRKWIRQAVEDSLSRLQTDYIDLYQSHVDDAKTPQEETLRTYAELIQEGKVRIIGASNFTAARLKSALEISAKEHLPAYQTLQPLYNLYDRAEFEKELQALCVEKKISVIPYFPLGSGFLTGKYRSKDDLGKSERGSRVARYLDEKGFRILNGLDEVSKAHQCTPSTIALSWLMERSAIAAPIASATSVSQLEELMKAGNVKLRKKDMELLNKEGGL